MRQDLSPLGTLERRLRPPHKRITDLRFLILIDPTPPHPLAGYGVLEVAPSALLHPQVPQPDGQKMYELLTRHPRRDPSTTVYLCDITDELALQGLTWNAVDIHWLDIIDALVDLVAYRHLPALAIRKHRDGSRVTSTPKDEMQRIRTLDTGASMFFDHRDLAMVS